MKAIVQDEYGSADDLVFADIVTLAYRPRRTESGFSEPAR